MKKEEKHLRSEKLILVAALKEFSEKGYLLGSVNGICSEGKISKGNLYHYYAGKDELYLLCIKKCFNDLTAYLKEHVSLQVDSGNYFEQLTVFFKQYPVYRNIFIEATTGAPKHLQKIIEEIVKEYKIFDRKVFDFYLGQVNLRDDVTRHDFEEIYQHYRESFNNICVASDKIKNPEKICELIVSILLFGIVDRADNA